MINSHPGTTRESGSDANAFMYRRYVSSGGFGTAPKTEADLSPRMPGMQQIVRRYFPRDRNARILDLGCGNGVLLLAAQGEGYRNLSGVDGSAEQVAVAQALGIRNVREGDLFAELSTTSDTSLDCVVTLDVIEHLSKSDLLRLMTDVHRALRPGGRWIIHVPNAESPFFGRVRYGDFTHELAFTRQSLSALLRAGNFVNVLCVEDQPIPHGLKSTLRFMLWKLLRQLPRVWIAVETGEISDGIYSQNFLVIAEKRV